MMLDRHEAHEELNPKARDPREAGVAAGRPVAMASPRAKKGAPRSSSSEWT